MATLSLNPVINVTVVLSPVATVRSGFDLGLIIGTSSVLSASKRVAVYSSLQEMIDAGFGLESQELSAASYYFAQNPPPSRVAIGFKGESESALDALKACREENSEWYAAYLCEAEKADILSMAAYTEAMAPEGVLFYDTKDSDVLAGTSGNVMLSLQESGYKRTFGLYSTENYSACAVMGYAMGANTGDPDSAYTLKNKQLINLPTEALTAAQVDAVEGQNGNVYVNRGVYFDVLEPGVTANGSYFDEVLNLDMLVNNIKRAVMDLLQKSPKVPQTEGGVTSLVNTINGPLDDAVLTGFAGPGIWKGPNLLNLKTGDTLPKGYLVQTQSLIDQSQEDRENRKAPKIYIALKLAGAIESVAITLNVNR